jgi:Flp pilus assembly protein TadG
MRITNRPRKGVVAVLVAICLTVLLGFVAIALDGGLLMDNRRRVQAAADVAALAAAESLYLNWRTNQGLDPSGVAAAMAQANAQANGFTDVTVNIPPLSGYFTGQAGYAEVIVNYDQPRYFSTIWGTTSTRVTGRAVGRGMWASNKMGILVLNPTASGSLTNTGGGSVTVVGVPTIIDSNSPTAGVTTGNGTVVSTIDVTGVPGVSGPGWPGPVNSGQTPVPDPLAYIPEPNPNNMIVQSKHPTHVSSTTTTYLQPGVYQGGIQVTGQGSVVMAPGIYYMDGGGFSFTGQGNLLAAGVMIYNAPQKSNDIVNIQGLGSIDFSPPTDGIYKGIALFQERSSANTMAVSGNGASEMYGTFYTAGGTLSVTGNGGNQTIGSQYISYNLTLSGNGNFYVNWNVNTTANGRILGLVE